MIMQLLLHQSSITQSAKVVKHKMKLLAFNHFFHSFMHTLYTVTLVLIKAKKIMKEVTDYSSLVCLTPLCDLI